MRRERKNRLKKRKIKGKSKMRTVKIVFKKKGGGKAKKKVDKTMKKLRRLSRKQIVNELSKSRIKTNRGSPTGILRDILFYKKTTGINIVKDFD